MQNLSRYSDGFGSGSVTTFQIQVGYVRVKIFVFLLGSGKGPSINYVRFLGGGGVCENLTFSDMGGRGGYLISDVRKYVVIFCAEILTKKVVFGCFSPVK